MANTVSSLSYANTFGDWMVTTNSLVRENNNLAANNYIKGTGTLFLNDPSLGLQVANNAIIAGTLQSTGVGSSASIQNGLTVGGTSTLANTTVTGTLTVNGNTLDPVYINTVNNTQNTNITAVNQFAQGAYNTANLAVNAANTAYSLALTDATNITLVNQYATSAYNLANTNSVTINTNQTLVNSNVAAANVYLQSSIVSTNNYLQGVISVGPAINPSSPKNGDIQVSGSVISIYASGSWRQIFPAEYS